MYDNFKPRRRKLHLLPERGRAEAFFIFLLFLFACTTRKHEQEGIDIEPPKEVEAKGYVVTAEIMAPPIVKPVGTVKTVSMGKPPELEMQALHAQMNSYFIFYSLNSINRFILQNDRKQASKYLTKFSRLVRMILQNSQASLVPLGVELEALRLYPDLEEVRFDHRFGYEISMQKVLDVEMLKVPPQIIQPYTENAIWHGLMHKDGKGNLDIEVNEENEHLVIKIADDGIGRKAGAAIASKSATKHRSMGLRITADRIAMLQNLDGGESPVRFIDFENVDGSAAGTKVIIKMPIIYG